MYTCFFIRTRKITKNRKLCKCFAAVPGFAIFAVSNVKSMSLTSYPIRPGFLFFAGPCSAESLEQLQTVATFLCRWNQENPLKVKVLRAGAWKPRTRPGEFEGRGEEALAWLAEVKQEWKIAVGTEVANAKHVEACLKHGIDMVWTGARTTANPFLMQEIASALEGCSLPVYIKNPISPDLGLWSGGVERIARKSKGKIGCIHRGFGLYNPEPYRNAPLWELAVEMKRLYPDLPLLCDPSHIGGKREYLAEISQTALDLEMDGLMLELHPEPDKALSDAKQQIDFPGFEELVSKWVFKHKEGNSSRMTQIRCILDEIDDELIQLLGRRMRLVQEIGNLKKDANLSVLQLDRWNAVVERALSQARQQGLDENFVRSLLHCIHAEALRLQRDIVNKPFD